MNYVNSIFRQILEDLPGEVTIINGRVRHPQSQGVVEKGNAKVEEMLACHFQSEKADDYVEWTSHLPMIQCKLSFVCLLTISFCIDQLNTCVHVTINTTPYEVVFGQPPRATVFPGVSGLIME